MSKSLVRYRTDAFRRQAGRCYYCNVPMWDDDLDSFAREHTLSRRAARWLQCTAEHLHAKCDGGADSLENVVAACRLCNLRRHRDRRIAPTPDAFRRRITRRLSRGRWHFARVLLQSGRFPVSICGLTTAAQLRALTLDVPQPLPEPHDSYCVVISE
jgi:hypothetical protein